MTDYANTAHARENRARKATALADTARRLGVRRSAIERGGGTRGQVWREAGLTRAPSIATWAAAVELLRGDPEPDGPARACANHPDRAGRLHLAGLLCDEECAPWRRAGHPNPSTAQMTPRERTA